MFLTRAFRSLIGRNPTRDRLPEGFRTDGDTIGLSTFTAAVAGLTDSATHGPTAQTGVTVTGSIVGLVGGEVIVPRWTANGAVIDDVANGSDTSTFTPIIGSNIADLAALRYSPTVDGVAVSSAGYTARRAPPTLVGSVEDVLFAIGLGPHTVATASFFAGDDLTFSTSAANSSVLPATGVVTVTDGAASSEDVTVEATNSGGTVSQTFEAVVAPRVRNAANGNVAGDFTVPPAPVGVAPSAFVAGDWSAATGAVGEIDLTVSTLPSDGGSTITDLEFSTDGGSTWASLGSIGAQTFNLASQSGSDTDLVDGANYDLMVRAVNAVGNGPDSDTKSVAAGGGATTTPPIVVGHMPYYVGTSAGHDLNTVLLDAFVDENDNPVTMLPDDILLDLAASDSGIDAVGVVGTNGGRITTGWNLKISEPSEAAPARELAWRRQGSTVDTSVDYAEHESRGRTGVFVIIRGALATGDPFSGTPTVSSASTGMPNPPSFTTTFADELRGFFGALDDDRAQGVTHPNATVVVRSQVNTGNSTAMAGFLAATAIGSFDPAPFAATANNDDEHWACHFGIRPAA